MPLFPTSFIDELKSLADIVQVISDTVQLRKMGVTYKGLCPFHGEKTPSFNVSPDKGFFKCFGCGVGGDVIKFVELRDRVGFSEAVKTLAARFGMAVPEAEGQKENEAAIAERETLLKIHDVAAGFYRSHFDSPAARRAREDVEKRTLTAETIAAFGYGYAPAVARDALNPELLAKFPRELVLRSGLAMLRDDGRVVDRFRNRLMIPIHRESGPVIAFGGRALEKDQVPKYLNSPETPLYTKGRTLYGLHQSKTSIRQKNFAVLVEGYFDLAQLWQAGVQNVVASSGTALTPAQGRLLRRATSKIILSFDPDAAGQGAAARSSEMLVAEGFQVNVALLPEGQDPDTFVRTEGSAAYAERLKGSQPYLDYLLDRAAARHAVGRPEGRRAFLTEMLTVAATIPDAAARDQFADRLAHKARITEEVVRQEIRKAAVRKKTELPAAVMPRTPLRPAESGLLWHLLREPATGFEALLTLDEQDFEGLASGDVLRTALALGEGAPEGLPKLLGERLSEQERAMVSRAAKDTAPVGTAAVCAAALRRLRHERERADIQEQIDRLLQSSTPDAGLNQLLERKHALDRQLNELNG
ncbi:MAG: DNA primase [Acidobacteriota bacterium]|nr:DNA primase [Acidobacteriota bacterium]